MTASRILIASVLILVTLTILAGCVKPPESSGSSSGSSGGQSWFSPGNKDTSGGTTGSTGGGGQTSGGGTGTGSSSTTEPEFMTPATPFPVETTPPPTTSSYTRLPDPTPPISEYVAIFYNTLAFKQNRTAYSYRLERPPMIIEICIEPNMTSRTIWYESRVGEREEKTETVTTISPAAWFEVTVRDQATGTIVAEEGYARSYSVDTAKKLTIRSPGTFLVEFAGNELSAEIQIRVPKTTNQTGQPVRNLSCGSLLL